MVQEYLWCKLTKILFHSIIMYGKNSDQQGIIVANAAHFIAVDLLRTGIVFYVFR